MTPIDWPVLYAGLLTARLEQDTRILRVRMLVDSAYAEPLDAERLATEACLSRAQLVRAFRQGLPAPLVPACFALRFGGLRVFEKSSPADAG